MKEISARRVFRDIIRLNIAIYAGILVCVAFSNISLFDPNWPFGLFASFLETLIIAYPVVILAILICWRRAIIPAAILGICAFYPVLSFEKFVEGSNRGCLGEDCISIVSANLRHHPPALTGLSESSATDADLLIMTEVPVATTAKDLLSLFPMDGAAQVAFLTDVDQRLGSRLAVLSRVSLDNKRLHVQDFPKSGLRARGILTFDYRSGSTDPISFVVVHPPPPKGPAATASRDLYLKSASTFLENKSNFIMIGDFNLTPWEPKFLNLPGKRAGNPRWDRTWNARKFWQRIPIDHALIGEEVTVIKSETLPDVGSDHFPIHLIARSGTNTP